MKNYVLLLLLMIGTLITHAQKIGHLDTLLQPKRDSILLSLSKKAILRYGPDYYEINRPPKIERGIEPEEGEYAGRVYYKINYFHDDEFYKKRPDGWNLVEVYIWEDTAFVSDIMFGDNGIGLIEGKEGGLIIKDGKRMMIRFIRSKTTRYVYIDYIPNEDE